MLASMDKTVSELIAARIRALRQDRGMSVEQLADRCRDAGMPGLTAQTIYKLEKPPPGRPPRPVAVDELLVLAAVLDIAPVHLVVGLDDEQVPVTPSCPVSAYSARQWIRGVAPIPGGDRNRYEANVPDEERKAQWFMIRDATNAEVLVRTLEQLQGYVQLLQQREAER